ncbi:MAG: hypothetical protein GWN84_14270 [Gammaproteobacteria bacterium]|nr:hypothetical protein [Gammaproteobacteria bacterium]NIR83965.1 hypothetical protein [Gammaproteobacteria bacterium]NIR89109.1 hypothetical protein [Gammaproteobacteria bacterium]NIU04911.1 hypothetical protein [Gammaproteobacteria bacterium]NIV52077.1 hypothetical protein [Gammaproteobacteria bacterium]
MKQYTNQLAFYDFPAEHWVHLRTTNPIESTFGTIRHRADRAKGYVKRETTVITGVKLQDGIEVKHSSRAPPESTASTRFDNSPP